MADNALCEKELEQWFLASPILSHAYRKRMDEENRISKKIGDQLDKFKKDIRRLEKRLVRWHRLKINAEEQKFQR